jgi:hypothetical protein
VDLGKAVTCRQGAIEPGDATSQLERAIPKVSIFMKYGDIVGFSFSPSVF